MRTTLHGRPLQAPTTTRTQVAQNIDRLSEAWGRLLAQVCTTACWRGVAPARQRGVGDCWSRPTFMYRFVPDSSVFASRCKSSDPIPGHLLLSGIRPLAVSVVFVSGEGTSRLCGATCSRRGKLPQKPLSTCPCYPTRSARLSRSPPCTCSPQMPGRGGGRRGG